VRPVKAYPNAPRRLADPRAADIDLVVLRESTEGLFYSAAIHQRGTAVSDNEVTETLRISRPTTEKLHDFAFQLARKRKARGTKGRVTCVGKANVFRAMALFRKIFDERAAAFPDIEASGELDSMLERTASHQENEMDSLLSTMLSVLEPALIIFMGVIVLAIVMAILLPIFQLNQLIA